MSDQEALSFDWTFVFYWLMATTAGLVLSWLLVPAIALVAGGVGAAILQGLVLFRRFPRAWQWILVSVIGWLAGVALTLVVIPPGLGFLSGAVLGIAAGTAQWLMLRSLVHWAGWWILVSALAWGTGLAAGLSVLPRVVLAGAMAGMATGIVLELLLLHPKRVDLRER